MRFSSVIVLRVIVCLLFVLILPVDVFAQKGPPDDDGSAWVKIPIGGSASLKRKVTDTSDQGGTKDNENANSAGPSALATGGGKLSENITGSAPDAHTSGGAGAKGGDTKANVTAFAFENLWADPFLWFGVTCELLALACVLVPLFVKPFPLTIAPRYPIILASAGIGFFAIAVDHKLLYVMLGGILVVTAGPLLVGHIKDAIAKKKLTDESSANAKLADQHLSALDETLEGALTGNPVAHASLLEHLDDHAEKADKTIILSRLADSGLQLQAKNKPVGIVGLAPAPLAPAPAAPVAAA